MDHNPQNWINYVYQAFFEFFKILNSLDALKNMMELVIIWIYIATAAGFVECFFIS
jgi:hypothetical protein